MPCLGRAVRHRWVLSTCCPALIECAARQGDTPAAITFAAVDWAGGVVISSGRSVVVRGAPWRFAPGRPWRFASSGPGSWRASCSTHSAWRARAAPNSQQPKTIDFNKLTGAITVASNASLTWENVVWARAQCHLPLCTVPGIVWWTPGGAAHTMREGIGMQIKGLKSRGSDAAQPVFLSGVPGQV